jgi:hypothetical protein
MKDASLCKLLSVSLIVPFGSRGELCERYEQQGMSINVQKHNNNNNNNIYLLQLGCHPVAVVTLHVHKT